MTLYETNYTTDQQLFLDSLKNIGAVLDTVILKTDSKIIDVELFSKTAAIKGMEIIAAKYALRFKSINPGLDIENYFTIKVFPYEELKGEPVTFSQFLGDGYTFESNTLSVFKYDNHKKIKFNNLEDGFAKALLDTPHGLGITQVGEFASTVYAENETKLLKQIIESYLEIVLQVKTIRDTENLTIIRWSDNWSNYFEAGKEWWGTFCWTIYDVRQNTITLIAASTTD